MIRCFGVLVSFISVCLLPCHICSNFRLKQKVMVRVGALSSKYPVGGWWDSIKKLREAVKYINVLILSREGSLFKDKKNGNFNEV